MLLLNNVANDAKIRKNISSYICFITKTLKKLLTSKHNKRDENIKHKKTFLPRDIILVRNMLWPCVCVCLCLSQVSVLPKWLNAGSIKQHHTIAHVDPCLHFGAQAISLERMKLDTSNLVCRLNVKSTGITHVKVLQYGVHLGSVTSQNLGE